MTHFNHQHGLFPPRESTKTNFTEFSSFESAFDFAALNGASVNRSAETVKTLNLPPLPPATKSWMKHDVVGEFLFVKYPPVICLSNSFGMLLTMNKPSKLLLKRKKMRLEPRCEWNYNDYINYTNDFKDNIDYADYISYLCYTDFIYNTNDIIS